MTLPPILYTLLYSRKLNPYQATTLTSIPEWEKLLSKLPSRPSRIPRLSPSVQESRDILKWIKIVTESETHHGLNSEDRLFMDSLSEGRPLAVLLDEITSYRGHGHKSIQILKDHTGYRTEYVKEILAHISEMNHEPERKKVIRRAISLLDIHGQTASGSDISDFSDLV